MTKYNLEEFKEWLNAQSFKREDYPALELFLNFHTSSLDDTWNKQVILRIERAPATAFNTLPQAHLRLIKSWKSEVDLTNLKTKLTLVQKKLTEWNN